MRRTDGNWSTSKLCNGEDEEVISDRTCTIPMSVLVNDPFYLAIGDAVSAKITARNIVGFSPGSTGDGAIAQGKPDAPA